MTRKTNQTFLYTHLMRWEPLAVQGAEGRAWIKTLSKDEQTGARTALIKYDPGFKQKRTTSQFSADIYVLDGQMETGEHTYQKGTYHYRPGGTQFGPVESPNGSTRLVFADPKAKSSRKEVFIQDVNKMPWGPSYSNIDPTGYKAGTRLLREDPEQKLTVLIHAFFIADRSLPNEGHRHDHMEEAFTIEGEMEDYLGDVDGHVAWVPGTYICRVPNASLHGDTIKHKIPMVNIVRRGWVGDTVTFHQAENKANIRSPIKQVVEFDE